MNDHKYSCVILQQKLLLHGQLYGQLYGHYMLKQKKLAQWIEGAGGECYFHGVKIGFVARGKILAAVAGGGCRRGESGLCVRTSLSEFWD